MIKDILALYGLEDCTVSQVSEHNGGRNQVFICTRQGGIKYVLRVSALSDRTLTDYLAETGFVHYLAESSAPVADVIPSLDGSFVQAVKTAGGTAFACMFECARGEYISGHGYRYIDGVPLDKYFFDTGRALGKIHAASKKYTPAYVRYDYTAMFNKERLDALIPDTYAALKRRMFELLGEFEKLDRNGDTYGLVHFDFSDGNYYIDYSNGDITAFDFDNCCYCWYMYDLANLWLHGEGWLYGIEDSEARAAAMKNYFDTILAGYTSETEIDERMLDLLPMFIDLVVIEGIVDEFDVSARKGELPDPEDIDDRADILINCIPYAGLIDGEK